MKKTTYSNRKVMLKPLLDSAKIDWWITKGKNVLFEGKHGVGKTHMVKDGFDRAGFDWLYISGALADPYFDFIGVPCKVVIDGEEKLKLLTLQDLEKVDAIFIDEYNRADRAVKNGCMELIQFKSVNGRQLPKLKVVWAAINPDDDLDTYHIDPLDPAQRDRFHVHIQVPYEPCPVYFTDKFGAFEAESAIKWWQQLGDPVKAKVSPRRLDYAMEWIIELAGDVKDVLPLDSNPHQLVKSLDVRNTAQRILKAYNDRDSVAIREVTSHDNNIPGVFDGIVKTIEDGLVSEADKASFLAFVLQDVSNDVIEAMVYEHVADNPNPWWPAQIAVMKDDPKLEGLVASMVDRGRKSSRTITTSRADQATSLVYDAFIADNTKKDLLNRHVLCKAAYGFPNPKATYVADDSFTGTSASELVRSLHSWLTEATDGRQAGLSTDHRERLWDGRITKLAVPYKGPKYGGMLALVASIGDEPVFNLVKLMELISLCSSAKDTMSFYERHTQAMAVVNTVVKKHWYASESAMEEYLNLLGPEVYGGWQSLPFDEQKLSVFYG